MRIQKGFFGILAGIVFLFPTSSISAKAEAYWPVGPEVEAVSAVVMEASTGTVLYEKNPHEQLYPASITKIMTTLLALENCSLDEEVTFSYESVHSIDRTSTHIFRDVDEVMTMEQCLYAVMLGSANDCAYAVAEHTGKGYENFIAMMNDRAALLGCEDTHFNNAHGLPDEQHYTSAYDMGLISCEALKNDMFRMITATDRYTIPVTNKHPQEETYLVNHHKMLTNYQGERQYLYDGCIGGKTGYTDTARNTLVTFAERNGMTLVCVVMKENGSVQYTDTKNLLDYCFANFTPWNIAANENHYEIKGTANAELFGIASSFADLDRESKIILPNTVDFSEATYEIVEGDGEDGTIAIFQYTYGDRHVGSGRIKTTDATVKPYVFNPLKVEEDAPKQRKIRVEYIFLAAGAVAALAMLIVFIVYLANNFYILRHRSHTRRRDRNRFKVIKKGRHSRWKTRW